MGFFATIVTLLSPAPPAAPSVDYLREVKPLLNRHCYACHGAEVQKAKLRVDTAAALRRGGQGGPALVPGRSADSLLYKALVGDGLPAMPFKKPPLSPEAIALVKRWIDEGAKAPADEPPDDPAARRKGHWAFRPPARPALPVPPGGPALHPIDAFIRERLARDGLSPSPEADRATLLRRLSLDLIGLPPTPAEVEAFVNDASPNAYERVVERLLASPHYGERWARHWLDLARYADSNGFTIDAPREIWKYRDWVIDALNRDLPYDQFVVEQLAGDLLPRATTDQKVATGFHRNTLINQEGGIDPEQFRVEAVVDRVNTTGAVFLGLTVGCAQCHDHKYDPLTQKEYYQLFAFFNNCDEPTLSLASPEEVARRDAIRAQIKALENELAAYEKRWKEQLSPEEQAKLKPEVLALLNLSPDQRTERQKTTLLNHLGERDPGIKEWAATLAGLKRREPKFPTTMVLQERARPRETHVHINGDFTRKGERVTPGVPAVLPPLPDPSPTGRQPNRLDLARWLTRPDHPLFARVAVNRLWQQYFGTGLVETSNDFGTQGAPPTHPELLDWLATEFPARGWSLKAMHRLIVTSTTYRQCSAARPELTAKDPRNLLLGRQHRLRLEAEVVRDSALAVSGLLSPKVGGPSVFPPQPDGVFRFTQIQKDWKVSPGPDRYRRGLYTYFWRAAPHPALIVFDAPEATTTCTRRNRSNTPLQALTLLNDEAHFECAQALAARLLREGPADDAGRLDRAFRLCLVRAPSAREAERLGRLLDNQRAALRASPAEAQGLLNPHAPQGADSAEYGAWLAVARVLLNLDEFITRE